MAGCNLVDLMELSSAKRQIVRLILRETTVTDADLAVCVRELQNISQAEAEALLAALTAEGWLVRLARGNETIYRVNLVRKSGEHNQAFWSRLGIDQTEITGSADDRSMMRGGKRTLPGAIWDSLESDQPFSRDTLIDAIRQRKSERKESASELGRALRKRVLDALDAIAREDPTT
ncbi:MAG: hypothetical protein IAE80_19900 [Anaerolinea sp.]|nr:hypothetical protein [Anaerolinea sp.]